MSYQSDYLIVHKCHLCKNLASIINKCNTCNNMMCFSCNITGKCKSCIIDTEKCNDCDERLSLLYKTCTRCKKNMCVRCMIDFYECNKCDDLLKTTCRCGKRVHCVFKCVECNAQVCEECDILKNTSYSIYTIMAERIYVCDRDKCLKSFVSKNRCLNCNNYAYFNCSGCMKKICKTCILSCKCSFYDWCFECCTKHINRECEKCKEFDIDNIIGCNKCHKHSEICYICDRICTTMLTEIKCLECDNTKTIYACKDHNDIKNINTRIHLKKYQKITHNFCSYCRGYVCSKCSGHDYFRITKNNKIHEKIKLCKECVLIDDILQELIETQLEYKIVVKYLFDLV